MAFLSQLRSVAATVGTVSAVLRAAAGAVPAILWLTAATPAAAQGPSLEYAVKATYLYKLAPFVNWPAAALGDAAQPLVICVQGADPFGAMLDKAVAGQRVGARAVTVRRMARLDTRSGCQIAYLGGSPAQSAAQALEVADIGPVLTVTDEARTPGVRGIVHLVLDAGRVRFSIDAGQAEQSGLTISSKLLALAVGVKR